MGIPIVDINKINQPYLDRFDVLSKEIVRSGAYIKGPHMRAFEKEFAAELNKNSAGDTYCIGVNNGTDALIVAMLAAGVGPGDKVLTTDMSYVATAQAILMVGAVPIFVDITNDGTDNIDIAKAIEKAKDTRCKYAVIPHMHGYPVDLRWFRNNLILIEDCAQAHFAIGSDEKFVGTSDFGAFSFYPTKNLGAAGDAGAVTINLKRYGTDAVERALMAREHGALIKDQPRIMGYNTRLSEFQAALLRLKLPDIYTHNKLRQEKADLYNQMFSRIITTLPHSGIIFTPPMVLGAVYHHYTLRFRNEYYRNSVRDELAKNGIDSRVYYPHNMSSLKPFKERLRNNLDCLNMGTHVITQQQCSLSIPFHQSLSLLDMEKIVSCVYQGLKNSV